VERRGRGRRSKEVDTIARERVVILLDEARKAAGAGKRERAKRYVALARRLGMRYNVSMPGAHRRWLCAECGAYLVPGKNASVRLRPQRFVIRCLECNAVRRVGRGSARPAARSVRK
jgi:ribonuclease P protein subunit RPR2